LSFRREADESAFFPAADIFEDAPEWFLRVIGFTLKVI